jgi:hypothetical protein
MNLASSGFSVSYDAARNRYLMDFPSIPSGYFYAYSANTPHDHYWSGALASLEQTGAHEDVYVLKPANPTIQLSYTTLLAYNEYRDYGIPFGFVAFGTATAQGAMPVSGSATYSAFVRGGTVDKGGSISGTAELQFNFGAGTLSGSMSADYTGYDWDTVSLGRYDFVNTVYSSGSTTFSGQLSNSALPGFGSFSGLFTGPAGQELMSSWSAPYILNGQTSQMFGVWVGKRN